MTPAPRTDPQRPKVLVIGCGFGGIEAVRALADAPVDVTLVDRTNHHLFQPLLYQVATAGLSAPSISAPIRHVLRRQVRRGHLTVLLGEVTDIDAAGRTVCLDGQERIGFDHLIVAAGATHSYFGHDDWAAHAPGMKTLADAFEIRRRVLMAFERAEREADAAARAAWLTFAVVGAGPTGVEMAGTLAEVAHHTLADEFRRIDLRQARIVLVEGAPRVLTAFPPDLSQRAAEQLRTLGVELLTDAQVRHIDDQGLRYRRGGSDADTALPARTVIWAAGVAASPLGQALQRDTGCTLDRAGRVCVDPDLAVPGWPQIQVIGDLASVHSPTRAGPPAPVPGVSPAAKQMGRWAAANLLRRLHGQPTRPFRYRDHGALATLGRRCAVVQVELPWRGLLKFSGWPAWLFWLFVHIYFLIGFRNRVFVMLDWAWSYITFERQARVVSEAAPPPPP